MLSKGDWSIRDGDGEGDFCEVCVCVCVCVCVSVCLSKTLHSACNKTHYIIFTTPRHIFTTHTGTGQARGVRGSALPLQPPTGPQGHKKKNLQIFLGIFLHVLVTVLTKLTKLLTTHHTNLYYTLHFST